MKVSIVIPIYNVGQYLRECLESCLAQTYANLEIICVDDGSTDNGGAIADEYATRDTRFKVIHKPNGGLPSARKAGIEAATGVYLFHLDGDDNIPINTISDLVKVARSEDSDIVVGDHFVRDGGESAWYHDSRLSSAVTGKEYLHFILTEGLFNIWGKLIRRSLYTDCPVQIPQGISMGEDLVAMIQLAFYSKKVSVSKTPCYTYYVRSTSMSVTDGHTIGELTDRSIFAVDFITRFLTPRADSTVICLLSNYVKRFIYEYMRSPYPVSLRKYELQTLCNFYRKHNRGVQSFAGLVCYMAAISLNTAKMLARLRNLTSKNR